MELPIFKPSTTVHLSNVQLKTLNSTSQIQTPFSTLVEQDQRQRAITLHCARPRPCRQICQVLCSSLTRILSSRYLTKKPRVGFTLLATSSACAISCQNRVRLCLCPTKFLASSVAMQVKIWVFTMRVRLTKWSLTQKILDLRPKEIYSQYRGSPHVAHKRLTTDGPMIQLQFLSQAHQLSKLESPKSHTCQVWTIWTKL